MKPSNEHRVITTRDEHHEDVATVITFVHSPGCHFCADAQQVLAGLAQEFPISVDVVDAGESRGQALTFEHRPALFPLVLVDGQFFSAGRLPRTKLLNLLRNRAVA
jgi:thiol-disulfide isomerase/thioredoxin